MGTAAAAAVRRQSPRMNPPDMRHGFHLQCYPCMLHLHLFSTLQSCAKYKLHFLPMKTLDEVGEFAEWVKDGGSRGDRFGDGVGAGGGGGGGGKRGAGHLQPLQPPQPRPRRPLPHRRRPHHLPLRLQRPQQDAVNWSTTGGMGLEE